MKRMKHTLFLKCLPMLTLSLFMVGCNSTKKLQKEVIETAVSGNVNPQQLEAVNGKVNFNYTTNFAPKQFDKKMILKITPKVQYGSQMVNLQPVFLQGEKVKDANYPVVDYDQGGSFTQDMAFNFKPGMSNSVLWADIEAMHGNKLSMLSPVVLNNNGIKVWQQPAFTLNGIDYEPAMTETFIEDVPATAVGVVSGYVLFPLGKSTIPQAEQNSAVMSQAAKAMEKVLADKNAKITNMFIYISNSPEGTERLNQNLANNRFRSAKNFFEKDLNLANTAMANNPKFVVQQTVSENWNGLYMLLQNSDIKNKEQIIKELKNAPNATARNKVIDNYINKVPELKDVILPTLRRADFFVFYTVPTTVEEDVQLTYFLPQLSEKNPAVTAQSNWQLLNDLAVMAIDNKEYGKAQKLLEAAAILKEDATINNNMGIVHAQMGRKREASQCFDKAKLRKEARYNMGLILMQNGEYGKAIPYLQTQPNINLAYSQLMNNDNKAAMDTFHKIKLKNAMDYYLMAVAAARTKDTREMTTSLTKAIQMQPNLKNWAATDISFYPYKGDPVYMQIVK